MHEFENKSHGSCLGGCPNCPASESACGQASGYRGWAFAGASMLVFILPLGSALAGLALGDGPGGKLAGGSAGLVAGAAVAWIVMRLLRPSGKETS